MKKNKKKEKVMFEDLQ